CGLGPSGVHSVPRGVPMSESYRQRLVTLEIGLAGCHGQTTDGASVTLYDRRLPCYYGELVEGGWVIDKAAVLDPLPGLTVMAARCRGKLVSGRREAFRGAQDSFVAHALAAQPENGFGGLARLMLAAPDCGAFDDVSPDVFAAWWRQQGARIGQRQGNR